MLKTVRSSLEAGSLREAEKLVEAMLDEFPQDLSLHREILRHLLHFSRAEEALNLVHTSVPLRGSVPDLMELGRWMLSRSRVHDSIGVFQNVCNLVPGSAEAWYLLGAAYYQSQGDVHSRAAFTEALRLAPGNPDVLRALAEVEFSLEDYGVALPRFELLLDMDPSSSDLCGRIARCHSRLGNPQAALVVCKSAISLHPGSARLRLIEAQLQEDLGDAVAAKAAYEKAMGLEPNWLEPLAGLLMLVRRQAPAELVARAEELLREGSPAPPLDRAYLHYALGGVKDAEEKYAEAFFHWTEANTLRRQLSGGLDVAGLNELVASALRVSPQGQLATDTSPCANQAPVFVVGMPRSGTTLVEQLIAAHPNGHGAGELSELSRIADSLRLGAAGSSIPSAGQLSTLAQEYMAVVSRGAREDATRFVDKQPYNFFHLGLAFILFPNAKVIWCRRDPRDIAISIFGESFSPKATYATQLEEIYVLYRAHIRLMEHWMRSRPASVLPVDYEVLVSDFEKGSRSVIEFLGLPWSDQCLAFHLERRHVQTNSRWQVRQPVHTRAIGRWRNYRDYVPGGNLGWVEDQIAN